VDDAAVLTDGDVAEQFVLAFELLHFRHDVVGLIAAGRGHGVEISQRGRIDPGLVAARHLAVHARPGREAFGEGAGVVIDVPVERFQQLQALRDLQPHAVDVIDEEKGTPPSSGRLAGC
jgi:hypothetical protein